MFRCTGKVLGRMLAVAGLLVFAGITAGQVGVPRPEPSKCCVEGIFTSCTNASNFNCAPIATPPTLICNAGDIVLGSCTNSVCTSSLAEHQCGLKDNYTVWLDKCVRTGEIVTDGCPEGKHRCKYDHYHFGLAVQRTKCVSGSTACP